MWHAVGVAEPVVSLFQLAETSPGLPEPPPEALWGYLDAAARCLVRFGARRTTARDIAREAGVERTTLYRNVGTLDQVYRLLLARETHRLIEHVTSHIPVGVDGPGTVTETVGLAIAAARAHPVLAKLTTDEPEMIAEHLLANLDGVIAMASTALTAGLEALATTGAIAPVNVEATAEWIARFGLTAVLSTPSVPLPALFDAVLRPLLDPNT